MLLLSIDTCGPEGSVALARSGADAIELVAETRLAGKTYSAQLVPAIARMLADANLTVADLDAIAVVNGPGSFTGVRIGVSAAKALAEAAAKPIVALSRLAVLARKAGAPTAAIDAHRGELYFVELALPGESPREFLTSPDETAAAEPHSSAIAVCENTTAEMLKTAFSKAEAGIKLIQIEAPTAADAVPLALERLRAGNVDDVATLDGNYLRCSDAEIFSKPL